MGTSEDAEKAGSKNAANSNDAPKLAEANKSAETIADSPKIDSPAIVPAQGEPAESTLTLAEAPEIVSPLPAPEAAAPAASAAATVRPEDQLQNQPTPSFMRATAAKVVGKIRQQRLVPIAAALLLTAGAGVLAGSIGTLGFERWTDGSATNQNSASRVLSDAMTRLNSDLVALKFGLDQSAKAASATNAQIANIAGRVDRIERAQDSGAKLAKLSEALDRLEKRMASTTASDTTGSIPEVRLPTPSPLREAAKPPVVPGWVLRNVYDGAALIQGRAGLIEVEPGDPVPGGGRVEAIRRQEGRWVVVTTKGLIVAP
jgi:hypothetical protein